MDTIVQTGFYLQIGEMSNDPDQKTNKKIKVK